MKKNILEEVRTTADWLKKKSAAYRPVTAIIAGSGLGNSLPRLEDKMTVPYKDIPGFPVTTVKGHSGELVFGRMGGADVVVMRGRFHYYEGHLIQLIAFPVRVLHEIGVKNLIATAAVGSLVPYLEPGDMVILKDHINMMGNNPLIGNYDEHFGPMFPPMGDAYKPSYRMELIKIAKENKIKAVEGVYMALSGPTYETTAEVKMYAMLGGTVAGMSVVPEVIPARQLQMNVAGICWISNLCTGLSSHELSHEEVLELGEAASIKMRTLLEGLLNSPMLEK